MLLLQFLSYSKKIIKYELYQWNIYCLFKFFLDIKLDIKAYCITQKVSLDSKRHTYKTGNSSILEFHILIWIFISVPAQVIWAVPGKNVDLPCDITPPTPSDSVTMVLWFKGSTGIPLYR